MERLEMHVDRSVLNRYNVLQLSIALNEDDQHPSLGCMQSNKESRFAIGTSK